MIRLSPAGMATMQTAQMTSRLNAAEPTMVEGPSSPAKKPEETISMTESRISGAEEPSAISVRLATVAFHTCTVKVRLTPLTSTVLDTSEEVMYSIATMKTSAAMATPTKDQSSRKTKMP